MKQACAPSDVPGSVFRTRAWVQAWIDTWGADPRIRLIDLGGKKDPLEHVYLCRQLLKKCIPVDLLVLAGVGCANLSTPRAEYIDLFPLLNLAGSLEGLAQLLSPLKWNRFIIPDIKDIDQTPQLLKHLSVHLKCLVQIDNSEQAYHVTPQSWNEYLGQLGANTRLAYVNRRKNLIALGSVEHERWPLEQADQFFNLLNQFHMARWGQPCFSAQSQAFLKNFGARLADEHGQLLFQVMRVNGDIVGVLLDIEWNGIRHNMQSGFLEQRFPKIALGALHMGYDIEDALQTGLGYDFMAGRGKHSDYKARIATNTITLSSYYLERGFIRSVRQLKHRISSLGKPT